MSSIQHSAFSRCAIVASGKVLLNLAGRRLQSLSAEPHPSGAAAASTKAMFAKQLDAGC